MRVLFLDIDGVLNRIDPPRYFTPARTVDGVFTQAEPELVYRLNLIVDRTGAEIVLSSSWRHFPDWREAMKASGVVKPLLDRTPNETKEKYERGYQIQAWLDAHPEVERYVIIDDSADMLPSQMPNFFQTSTKEGLTQEIADAVERHLSLPKVAMPLQPLDEFNAQQRTAHFQAMDDWSKPKPNGLACPQCGAELWDSNPALTLASNPPQLNVHCEKCQYRSYRIA